MLTAYTRRLPGIPIIPYLYPNFGREERDAILFLNNAFTNLTQPFVALTDDPAKADILLLAHNYSSLRKYPDYVRAFEELSRTYGKKVLVFWHGDRDDAVPLSNAIVLRTSLYGQSKRPKEIAMPAYAEDLLQGQQLRLREKGDSPVIGFCGWADYKNLRNRFGTYAQNALVTLRAACTGNPQLYARRKGISIRRDVIRILRLSKNFRTNFVIRTSYSGHRSTIGMDPEVARREYRENLLDCDLALCVKGDGNFSYRFYEALSMGRVPLLVDTDCVLPMENAIAYDDYILRIPLKDLTRLSEMVDRWWKEVSPDKFLAMQKKARETYEKCLSISAYLSTVCHQIKKLD